MTEPTPEQPAPAPTEPGPRPTFEERVEGFGREAEAAGQRWANDASVKRAADTASRVWGLVVLAIGLWFLADVTIGLDMPAIAWADIWPLGLILLGVLIVVRGMARRSA
jgi:hypothetical protein